MKKIVFLLLFVMLGVSFFTCPNQEAHTVAIMKEVDATLDAEMGTNEGSFFEKGLAKIGSAIGSSVVEIVLRNKLTVDNYYVCSVGKIVLEDKTEVVSVGLFNQVFTTISEELKAELTNKK